MMLFAAVPNPAFHHEGATILTCLPSGNPLTPEGILYGLEKITPLSPARSFPHFFHAKEMGPPTAFALEPYCSLL